MSDTLARRVRAALAAWLAPEPPATMAAPPPRRGRRMYHAARTSRLTGGWGSGNTSADAELATGLAPMRSRSRALVRDAGYARRARNVVVNNVIGPGIGFQGQVMTSRNQLAERVNSDIERAWEEWCQPGHCHTGGVLHFHDLERAVMKQVFEAGECFVRLHRRRFGASAVPMALELVEPERIADEFIALTPEGGNAVRLGVEVDAYCRPVAYFVRELHAGDVTGRVGVGSQDRLQRVLAADMLHLYVVDRWPQTRGVPWMHAAMRKLNDMDGLSEAEIVAARSSANVVGFIKSPEAPPSDGQGEDSGERPELTLEPGMVEHLAPGEDFVGFDPSRPNASLDPFMRMMLREVASSTDVSYESLSRDYSQGNYSNSRLGLLDDRDTWTTLQRWFIRTFRERLHREWLQAAVLARATPAVPLAEFAANPAKFAAVKWKPRGWKWVDPAKEVSSYKEAVRGGLTTLTDVIAETANGQDIEDIVRTRQRELEMLRAAGIEVDTTHEAPAPGANTAPTNPPAGQDDGSDGEGDTPDAKAARGRVVPIARTA